MQFLFFCFKPQVAYQGDPEGALIQFATHEEAKKAISSTEAVLNNRFIKVYWHREGSAPQIQTTTQKVEDLNLFYLECYVKHNLLNVLKKCLQKVN